MPIVDTSLYRQRDDIVAEMVAQLLASIPDAYTGDDGVISIVFEIEAGQLENLYLANQLLLEDIFIQTASYQALLRHGDQIGVAPNEGTQAIGTLEFDGAGGVYIPIGAEVGYDPGNGLDVIYFLTTTDGTIPDPGTPSAPDVAVNATAGNLTGTYEYMVTFVTAGGETLPSAASAAVNPSAEQVDLSNIPVGGTGTTARRIYRDKNGAGDYRFVAEISDNSTTAYTDNIDDATVAAASQVPSTDTAHKVTVDGEAENAGTDGNVAIGAISELSNAPSNLVSVTNPTAFTGGTEAEDTEDYRQKLLSYVQNPQTGSPGDLKLWAEAVTGVDSATVFANTPSAGSVTVRIVGPSGTVPDSTVIADVQAALETYDLANVTIVVDTFTAVSTDVDVTVTPSSGFALADVTQAVQDAITTYIEALEAGGTCFVSGIVDAVFGLAGVDDVSVTTPASNQTTPSDSKRTVGTITVS